jgi:hypothetical protein
MFYKVMVFHVAKSWMSNWKKSSAKHRILVKKPILEAFLLHVALSDQTKWSDPQPHFPTSESHKFEEQCSELSVVASK